MSNFKNNGTHIGIYAVGFLKCSLFTPHQKSSFYRYLRTSFKLKSLPSNQAPSSQILTLVWPSTSSHADMYPPGKEDPSYPLQTLPLFLTNNGDWHIPGKEALEACSTVSFISSVIISRDLSLFGCSWRAWSSCWCSSSRFDPLGRDK